MRTRCMIWALAALALASCAGDALVENPGDRDCNTLRATIEKPDTRTVVESGGSKVLWNAKEEISVFLGGTNYKFTSQNTEKAAAADFKGTPSLAGIGTSNPVWALSPYRQDSRISGERLTIEMPGTQKAVEGSFDPDAHLLAAYSTSTDINFLNVTGGLRFTLKQAGITKITFKGNDNETLAGNVALKFLSGTPQVDNVTSALKSITLEGPAGGFKTGVWYYITTIPVQFKKGFTLDFEAGTKSATFTTSQSVTAGRGVYGSIAEIDKNLEFKDPYVGVESIALDQTELTLEVGQTKALVATVLPGEATDKSINWRSYNPGVANVDQDGVVTAVSAGSTYIMAMTNDGYKWALCSVAVPMEYVDLGLPSGRKWAKMNLGASAPEDYGDYYTWGESEPFYEAGSDFSSPTWKPGKEKGYNWTTYKWGKGNNSITKYCTRTENGTVDGKTVLDPEDDAAIAKLGGKWRMPTRQDFVDLKEGCTYIWTELNGVNGMLFTGPNGNTLFLPAAGDRYNTEVYGAGVNGYYSSTNLWISDNIYGGCIQISITGVNATTGFSRCRGLPIRAVTE